MYAKTLLLRELTVIFLFLFVLCPSFAAASDADIIRRLERMEQEINRLKMENAELRKSVESDRQKKAVENEDLRKMVESDRQELRELKKSAGRLGGTSGLKTVLGKYDMQLYGRVKVDVNYDTADFTNYNDFLGTVATGNAERSASQPLGSAIARSGDLGYVYGDLEFLPGEGKVGGEGPRGPGSFLRIWKIDDEGDWRLVLDVSIPHPPAQAAPAD